MNEFKTYHPIVNFIYFLFVIGFSCFFMHPFSLVISITCGFLYSVMLKGKKVIKTNLIYILPMIILTAFINPLFNHEGVTVITYFSSGNPLTAESIIYGLSAAIMIASVICHFSCFNEIMTSDKFIYLFGKIIPSLSLIISMTFRFVPRFLSQLKVVTNAQKCIGRDVTCGSIIKRAKNGINILSIMLTWSLENAVDTADSMKARGYGIAGRTSFSKYTFDKRDGRAIVYILILGTYTLVGKLYGAMDFSFFPMIELTPFSLFSASVFCSYLLLCMCPLIIELLGVRRWKALRSRN